MTQIVAFPASRSTLRSSSTCALSETRLVRCWGKNDVGQLGYGHNVGGATEQTPVELEDDVIDQTPLGNVRWGNFLNTGGEVLALAAGGRCALRIPGGDWLVKDSDNPVYCWGSNDHGQVGVPVGASPSLTLKPADIGPVHWWSP